MTLDIECDVVKTRNLALVIIVKKRLTFPGSDPVFFLVRACLPAVHGGREPHNVPVASSWFMKLCSAERFTRIQPITSYTWHDTALQVRAEWETAAPGSGSSSPDPFNDSNKVGFLFATRNLYRGVYCCIRGFILSQYCDTCYNTSWLKPCFPANENEIRRTQDYEGGFDQWIAFDLGYGGATWISYESNTCPHPRRLLKMATCLSDTRLQFRGEKDLPKHDFQSPQLSLDLGNGLMEEPIVRYHLVGRYGRTYCLALMHPSHCESGKGFAEQ